MDEQRLKTGMAAGYLSQLLFLTYSLLLLALAYLAYMLATPAWGDGSLSDPLRA